MPDIDSSSSTSEHRPDDFRWTRVQGAFARASRAEPAAAASSDFVLAGHRVRVQVAGRRLFERIAPAFSHLGVALDASGADLTVKAWDASSTGVAAPPSNTDTDPGMNGAIEVSDSGRLITHRRRRSTAWLHRDAGEIVAVFDAADRTPLFDRGKPLHFLLAVWHFDRRVPLVHAGVVAHNGRGVLFPGKGGTGKSTAALSCALAGFDYVGDDTVGLECLSDRSVRAHSVYCSTNVAPHHIERFPALAPHAIPGTTPDEDKHLVLLNGLLPRPLARAADLCAIVVPRIVAHGGGVFPASRAEVLKALAPSTLLFFPGWGAPHLNFLADVVERLPGYRLEMGPDLTAVPHRVAELLERIS